MLKRFQFCRVFKEGVIEPVITPRFVPSCTLELLKGLGDLASEKKVVIQSHISESLDEVAFCKALHPEVRHSASPLLQHERILCSGPQKELHVDCFWDAT